MGKFIGVVAAALERQGDGFVQTTDVLEFGDETWVYYCRPHVGQPRPGWMDVAAGTLRLSVKQPQFRHDQLAWQPQISRDETGAYEYRAEVFGVEPGNNLFHLALPAGFLPVPGSWDISPLYGHADGRRFVTGWGGYESIWPVFRFTSVKREDFRPQATAIGTSIAEDVRQRAMTVMNPWTPEIARIPDQVELLRKLDAHLNDEETRTLMFELGVDYDNLPATTKKGKLRELILFMERQSQSPRLWQFLRQRYNFIIGD
jgi:hypothetical protein